MARRNPNVSVNIDLEADAGGARKSLAKDLGKIEADAKSTAKSVERAFENVSPELAVELDTDEIRQALDLAKQLDGMVADFTVDTDLEEIKQAEQIARSLRSFQGRVDLTVEGRKELADALDLAESMDQIRKVKVEVQGRQDLEKAAALADDLERKRTVDIDVNTRELTMAEAMVRELDSIPAPEIPIHIDGSEIEREVENAFDGIDVNNIADDLGGRLTGALAGAGAIGSGLALVAEAWGDDIMDGFSRGFNAKKTGLQLQIETGFSEADLRPIGEAAGEAYSEGFGEGLHELTLAAATLEASLRRVDESFDLAQATRSAEVLDQYLGVSIPESAVLAARMIRQGLAEDTVEAFDIMTYATQQYGDVGVETLEITREFGGVIARLGIDGPAAIDFIARSYNEGLLPTIDRGGELFEEFNIIMSEGTDDARAAVEGLNLDFDALRAKIIAGGPEARDAMNQILTAMVNLGDETRISDTALALFGMTIESATDKPEVIRALQTLVNTQLDVAGASEKATEQAKDMQTEWDKASRNIETLASKVGGVGLRAFNDLYGGIEQVVDGFGLWGDASDNISGQMEGLGDIIQTALLGPLGTVADDFIRWGGEIGSQVPFWQSWRGETDKAAESVGVVGNEVAQAEQAMVGYKARAQEAAGGTNELRGAVLDLDSALGQFMGRFDGDRVLRTMEEDAKAAIEATKGLTAENYNLTTGFDITTEKGRAAATALEDLSLDTGRLADAFIRGNATAADLAAGQQNVEATLRQVASQMGLNQRETDNMIARYGAVQREIITQALFQSGNALAAVLEYQRAIGAIPSQKTTTVATHFVTTGTKVYQTGGGFAEGGPVKGGVPIIVGEEGPELYVPDHGDGTIIPTDETSDLINNNHRARAMASAGVGASAGGGVQRIELVVGSDGSALGNLVVRTMRKEVTNRGGIDVVFKKR